MAQQNDQNHQDTTAADVRSTPNVGEHLDQIERVPASDLEHGVVQPMPSLSDDEFNALQDDIAEHGVRSPIDVMHSDGRLVVLDGNHRAAIAQFHGLTVPVRLAAVTGVEAIEWAVRANMIRRHLTSRQRRAVIAAEIERDPNRSDRVIAQLCGVSDKTVAAVRTTVEDSARDAGTDGTAGARGESATRKDSMGRSQPARKPRESAARSAPPRTEPGAEADIPGADSGQAPFPDSSPVARDQPLATAAPDDSKAGELASGKAQEPPVPAVPQQPCAGCAEKDGRIAELAAEVAAQARLIEELREAGSMPALAQQPTAPRPGRPPGRSCQPP